jgi:hypothetical protein
MSLVAQRTAYVALVAGFTSLLPASQAGGEKTYEVSGKAALTIEGNIAEHDPKFKIVPVPMKNEAMLPGKVFQVKLKGGKRYRIAMSSSQVDSVLMVKDAADKQLAWDDDGGGGLNALIMFDPPKDDTYLIHALSLKGTGAFNLLIREAVVHEVGTGLTLKGMLGKAKAPQFAYNVKFVAGTTYVIDMVSPNQDALDPYLLLHDPSGKKIAEDDDGGDGLNARIVYRAERTGTYRIVCTSFERSGAGPYVLTVREKK